MTFLVIDIRILLAVGPKLQRGPVLGRTRPKNCGSILSPSIRRHQTGFKWSPMSFLRTTGPRSLASAKLSTHHVRCLECWGTCIFRQIKFLDTTGSYATADWMRLETGTRANPARALTHHIAEGFYPMGRSIRNAESESAESGRTTKNLAISESCKSRSVFAQDRTIACSLALNGPRQQRFMRWSTD